MAGGGPAARTSRLDIFMIYLLNTYPALGSRSAMCAGWSWIGEPTRWIHWNLCPTRWTISGLRHDFWNALDQKVEKCADRRQHAVTVRNDRCDAGLACQPVGQDSLERTRPDAFIADITSQRHNAKAIF